MLGTGVEEDGSEFTWNYPQPDTESASPHRIELLQAGYPTLLENSGFTTDKQFRKWEMDNYFIVNRFELVEIGENRLQIDINCKFLPMLWFVIATLNYVVETWVEVKPELDPLIESLAAISNAGEGAHDSESAALPDWESRVKQPWLRDAIKMWKAGYSSSEIGKKHDKSSRTVTNRLSELRSILGEDTIPYHKKK